MDRKITSAKNSDAEVTCAVLAGLTHVVIGTNLGLPGVILPQLTDPTHQDLFLNTSQVALFGSLLHVGAMAGSLMGGILDIYLGQRVTLLLAIPFCLVLWLSMSFTSAVWVLQLLRALLGITQGFIGIASTNYLAEVTQSEIRGRLMSFLDIGRQSGILLVFVVGCLDLTWREVMLVCGCVTTVPTFIGLLFLPNSPRWLVTRGRVKEAHDALIFLRGPHYDSKLELQSIVDHFNNVTVKKTSTMRQMKQMQEPNVLYRLLFMAILTVLAQFTGSVSIVTYVVPIFQAANSTLNSYGSAVSIAGLRVAGTLVFMLVVERVGRRVLMVTSCLVCSVSLLLLGVYFLLQNTGIDVSILGWLPLISLLVYMPFVVAIQALLSILRSEMFSTSVRAIAVSTMFVVFYTSMFAVTQTFPIMTEVIGEQGVFWTYGSSCLLLALMTTVLLPETRGLTLEEVDDTFRYGKKIVLTIPCA
ncbi:Facilitated trehalose transporter Tret1 [Chionoecetes opilio]|uniref:Facilitated trehalose transporter Tret1 n=1 Tax=Chionoecetes opilio TaxID=41210 RepID=A0A8J4Y4J1_CHIOP|nr:Facilitated trehalose transporter Tret1 [Chionoecetes opilio]